MTPKELREQYESIVNVATALMNECKRLESRLSEVEKESERWHSEMLDVSRQLSESQKDCSEEQKAHETIGTILAEFDVDGTSVGCARKAKEEISRQIGRAHV